MKNKEEIKTVIERFGCGGANSIDKSILSEHGIDSLNIITDFLLQELPIDAVERFERLFKDVLKEIFSHQVSGADIREIISIQERLGFLLKYKSYAIKASNPLGYSIFIQRQGEGFSFQQHIKHKTEVFHILEVLEGGYVFLCDYKDWLDNYEEKAFADWLAGSPDNRYEQFRIYPKPGDVFAINKLGVVHTVIGCILEEYATVSTDMVDRLFDQNAGKEIPANFNHHYARKILKTLKFPATSRHVTIDPCSHQKSSAEITPMIIQGGIKTILSENAMVASRYIFEPGKMSEKFYDNRFAACFYFTRGNGQLIVGTEEEVNRLSPPTIKVSQGDLFIIPNGIHYAFTADGSSPLEFSEQKIPLDIAFI
ncbi:MAG TPA: cupin domain-containing protein [Candidatus Kapabacteria bacterium]|nr:cupin domain-containing protein [Candidatus Kapabacteria bacterium]